CGSISGSTRDSWRQTLFHIEICMVIDSLKPNKYVHTKKLGPYNAMALGIALELIEFCCLRAGARLQQFLGLQVGRYGRPSDCIIASPDWRKFNQNQPTKPSRRNSAARRQASFRTDRLDDISNTAVTLPSKWPKLP